MVEAAINNSFAANRKVVRRDPTYYIKNPARIYVETLGNKHYAINKMAKNTYMSKLNKETNQPEDHLPKPPQFSNTMART